MKKIQNRKSNFAEFLIKFDRTMHINDINNISQRANLCSVHREYLASFYVNEVFHAVHIDMYNKRL